MNINLLESLSRGAENAQTASELVALLGYKTRRDITREIARLRKKGFCICSSCVEPMGYYLPENHSDVLRFKKQMYSRIKEIKAAVKSAENLLQGFEEL